MLILHKNSFLRHKVFWLLLLISFFSFFIVISSFSMANNILSDQNITTKISTKIVVYYFYTNYRCYSCRMIEQYTKEAVEKFFDKELKEGKLIFKPVNIDEKENKHFIKDYQLYTKSVVISKMKDNEEVSFKNLDKVWKLLRNKEGFYSYIKEETNGFLSDN